MPGTTNKAQRAKKVSLTCPAPDTMRVFVAGDFNGWDPAKNPMKKNKNVMWKTILGLLPGTYQHRFFVDGTWQNSPACTSLVKNELGMYNCLLEVI